MAHSHSPPRSRKAELRAASRVTIIGMILDAVLGVGKVVGGLLYNSQALLVDGIHSFTDVVSDLVVLVVMKLSRKGPDRDHPYGHQRIETLGTMILGSFLIAIGGALAWDNILRLIHAEDLLVPGWPVLVVAVISVLSKEWIFRYTRRVGEKIHSDLITANAWHSRTDALSSVVVLLATAGAMAGFPWLDAVAAIVIAVIIAKVGWGFTWNSVKELVDTGLSAEDTRQLIEIAAGTEGVRNVHQLRSRRMGHDILLDIHVQVKPEISVSEGHQVGMEMARRMRDVVDNILDINFHIDAENDETVVPTTGELPSRQEVHQILQDRLELTGEHPRLRLHYLNNLVHLELFFEHSAPDVPLHQLEIEQRLADLPWLGSVKAWCPLEKQSARQ